MSGDHRQVVLRYGAACDLSPRQEQLLRGGEGPAAFPIGRLRHSEGRKALDALAFDVEGFAARRDD